MRINKKLFKVILIATLLIICNSCICYAAGTLPSLGTENQPTAIGGKLMEVTNTILGAVIAVGVVMITIFIAITGFGMILGSAEEKAVAKEKMGGYLIATVILIGGATIARLIISVASSF